MHLEANLRMAELTVDRTGNHELGMACESIPARVCQHMHALLYGHANAHACDQMLLWGKRLSPAARALEALVAYMGMA